MHALHAYHTYRNGVQALYTCHSEWSVAKCAMSAESRVLSLVDYVRQGH